MTFSLTLSNGDLVPVGSELAIVSGEDKLRQDISVWFTQRWNSDRMHPDVGSALQSYIGGVVDSNTHADIYSEALRVLNNYQTMVFYMFKSNPNLFSLSEIPYSIDSVDVRVTYDTVYLTVRVSNPDASVLVSVSPTSM